MYSNRKHEDILLRSQWEKQIKDRLTNKQNENQAEFMHWPFIYENYDYIPFLEP